jgi:hypothetical protein
MLQGKVLGADPLSTERAEHSKFRHRIAARL